MHARLMMSNFTGSRQEASQQNRGSSSNSYNGNSKLQVMETSKPTFHYHQGISMDWTPEDQAILEEGLLKYASESNIIRYAKIAVLLKNKTVRDVALRCRWMTKKEISKRRKEDLNLARKNRDKKVIMEKVTDPSATSPCLAMYPGFTPYAQGLAINSNDSGISYNATSGPVEQLLQQNSRAFEQISMNLATHQIHDNIGLLCRTRDNILKILDSLNDMADIMKQMPALPVKVNEDLANSILPPSQLFK